MGAVTFLARATNVRGGCAEEEPEDPLGASKTGRRHRPRQRAWHGQRAAGEGPSRTCRRVEDVRTWVQDVRGLGEGQITWAQDT